MPLDNSTATPSLWDAVGPLIQAGAGVFGASSGSGAASGGYNNAAGTIQGAVNTSGAALSPYSTTGSRAESALAGLYGIGGQAPNYDAFTNSPGYQFQVQQGDQAIQRAANASGGGFSSTTLAQLGKYNSGMAATQYQQYLAGLYGLTQTGAGAAANLGGQAIQGASAIGNAQVGAGQSNASGIAGAAGSVANLAGKLPWGQIGSGISSLFGRNTNQNPSGAAPSYGASPSYQYPNLSTTDVNSLTTNDLFGAGNYSSFQSPNLSSTDVNGMSTTDLFGPGTYTPSFDTGYSGGFNGNPG